jgi:tRNA A37 threonylcarbamoyladenosine synthetase subunit TsaC/SUA5/YrdC
MSFTVQQMLGSKALVSGTDVRGQAGSTVIDTTQWDELIARKEFNASVEAFDTAVEEFFKPLTDAADALKDREPKLDSAEFIVLDDPTEGVEAKPGTIVELTTDSIILRLIDAGQTDRIVWVSDTELGILAKS